MNKQTSDWIMKFLALIVLIIASAFGSYTYGQRTFEPQVTTQIEYVEVEKRAGYDFRLSDNTTMSLHEAILFTEGNIRSHQYYLDHPELQTSGSGNSTFQIRMIGQYNRLLQFLKGIMKMEE